jgi:5-formyltetrahydrofolate cyclo-ligase
MQGESFKMVPFRLPLKKKKFGILEAGNTLRNINKIDIAIVPVVGVDGNLQRIGFGKGMYDRFFAKLKKKPYTIFIQPKLCYTNKMICDSYDVACDVLITPDKIMRKLG